MPKAGFSASPDAGPDAGAAITGRRDVWLPEDAAHSPAPVYDRMRLRAGNRIAGPAVIEQMDATTLVPPGWHAMVLKTGAMLLEKIQRTY